MTSSERDSHAPPNHKVGCDGPPPPEARAPPSSPFIAYALLVLETIPRWPNPPRPFEQLLPPPISRPRRRRSVSERAVSSPVGGPA